MGVTEDGILNLNWEEVEGADSYLVVREINKQQASDTGEGTPMRDASPTVR